MYKSYIDSRVAILAEKEIVVEVPDADQLQDGQMKTVEIGDGKALLVKDGGQYYAIGAKCTHYAAPLASGVLCRGKVRCPWHGASFDVKTGDIEDFPGLDSIPTFKVDVADGKVKVRARPSQLASHKRMKEMTTCSEDDKRVFLLLGGGPTSLTCAETLRQEGFRGKVIIATKEPHLPYDRPKLSKAMGVTADDIALRKEDFYKKNDIEVKINMEACGVDFSAKNVTFKDGTTMQYDKLLLATGATPRNLTFLTGWDKGNISTLRTVDDANSLLSRAQGKDVIIIGTSFIGVETAACLAGKAKSITIVDKVEAPFQLALGMQVGGAMKKLLAEKGVNFEFGITPKEFVAGDDGNVKEVILADDRRLNAELCVVGIGVAPTTGYLDKEKLEMHEHGFIHVNQYLETSVEGVFAGGDVAFFPLFLADNQKVNIQHWQMAHKHGRVAALNMLGKNEQIHSVPYFWTVIFGKSLRYTGYGVGYDDIVIHGSLEDLKFVAFYTKGDKVIAVCSVNHDPIVSQAADVMLAGKTITKEEVQASPTEWTKKLSS